jgi:hypothetical protein
MESGSGMLFFSTLSRSSVGLRGPWPGFWRPNFENVRSLNRASRTSTRGITSIKP